LKAKEVTIHPLEQLYRAMQTGLWAFGRWLEEPVVIVPELGRREVWEELPMVQKARQPRILETVKVEEEAWRGVVLTDLCPL
jgi:hypothetical protein